jgi:hypothetical protein
LQYTENLVSRDLLVQLGLVFVRLPHRYAPRNDNIPRVKLKTVGNIYSYAQRKRIAKPGQEHENNISIKPNSYK